MIEVDVNLMVQLKKELEFTLNNPISVATLNNL